MDLGSRGIEKHLGADQLLGYMYPAADLHLCNFAHAKSGFSHDVAY